MHEVAFGRRSGGLRRLPMLAVAGVLALAGACKDTGGEAARPTAQPPIPVGTVKVASRPVTTGQNFVGRVEAINSVDLIARVEGFLTDRKYVEGQEVKAGDLLFVLEKDMYQAQVDAAQANLAQAQADADNAKIQADRARLLIRDQTISQATYDDRMAKEKEAAATVLQMKAALEQAQINLGYTDITAPFDGRVGKANFSVGALVGPSTGSLAPIVSQDPIYVTFQVSDRTVLQFQEQSEQLGGAKLSDIVVRLELSTGDAYPQVGVINFTDVKVDPNTDTLMVRATFANPKRLLVPGQYAKVTVERKEPVAALVIPQRAVLTDQSGNYVMVVGEGNRVAPVHITLGATQGTDVVVEKGLKEGQIVVTDGLQRIRPGQVVTPEPVASRPPEQTQGARGGAPAPPSPPAQSDQGNRAASPPAGSPGTSPATSPAGPPAKSAGN